MKGLIFFILIGSKVSVAVELHIRVTDESKRPIWTRLEVRGPDAVPTSGGAARKRLQRTGRGAVLTISEVSWQMENPALNFPSVDTP